MKRINLSKFLGALLACLALVSCEKGGETAIIGNDGSIRIAVEGKAVPAVKGGVRTPIVLESEDTTLTMWLSSAPMRNINDGIAASQIMTKGERITSANIIEKRNGDISLTAYQEGKSTPYIASSTLSFYEWKETGKISYWSTTDVKYLWPENGGMKFFSWSPSTATAPVLDPVTGIMTLDYTMPVDDATNQLDLLFASEEVAAAPNDNIVHLQFAHMLSALHFEIGKTNDMTVKEIKLTNLYTKGTVTYDGNAPVWTNLSTRKEFRQEYSPEEGDIHEDLAYKPECGWEPQTIGNEGKTFMVIPQTSQDENPIRLSITFCLKGSSTPITFEKDLTSEYATWQPGMEYRYTLNVTNGLDIEIDDKVIDDGKIKQNLQIQNVGGKPAYVRVLVTGNWVNKDREIVGIWDPADTNMGTFQPEIFGASYETEDWIRGTDGFFYYRHVLAPEAYIPDENQLFEKYTAKESGMPKTLGEGDYLEINVVAQAVLAGDSKAAITLAWGAATAEYVDDISD